MIAVLLFACAQQEVTPPPGPEVLAEPRESQPQEAPKLPSAVAADRDPWVLSSADGQLTLRVQARFDMDFAFFDPEEGLEEVTGDWNNGSKLRRSRLGIVGQAGEWTRYRLNADLSQGEVRDAYVEFKEWFGPGTLRVGHFREPIGLSNNTPVHNQTFMERPLANALFPSRNLGVSYLMPFAEKRGAWTTGVFRDTNREGVGSDIDSSNEFSLTSRVTYLVRDQNEGRDRVHIGGSFSWRNPDDEMVSYDGGTIARIGPDLIATGDIVAEEVYLFGFESAWIYGPNTFQAEYYYAGFDKPDGVSPGMKGWSLEASRMLTGEVRGYKYGRGAIWEVEPHDPYQPRGDGWGAFELGFRASRLDLQDEGVTGGDGLNLAVAWNWHLTRNYRLQTNFVRGDREGAGDVHAVLVRFLFRF